MSQLPEKLLSKIIEKNNKIFSEFIKVKNDTILIKMGDDVDITLSDPSFDNISKIEVNKNFNNTITVYINDYIFIINYSYDPVIVTKKHKDIMIYKDLYQIAEIVTKNNIINIDISDNLLTFELPNNNEINYQTSFNFRLLDFKFREQDIILHFTTGIYSIVNYKNNFHLFKLYEPNLEFKNKILGFSFDEIKNECEKLTPQNCMNTTLSSKYQDKTVSYNSKSFCKVKNDSCMARNNIEEMNFSFLDFNF
jgi:hypothetical protein